MAYIYLDIFGYYLPIVVSVTLLVASVALIEYGLDKKK